MSYHVNIVGLSLRHGSYPMMGSWPDLKYQAEWDLKSNKKVVGDYLGFQPQALPFQNV